MAVTSHLRGHKIVWDGSIWRYCDDNSPTAETYKDRTCGICDMYSDADGHDPCIENLPNVMNACCGHGAENEAYVMLEDRSIKRGKEAILYFEEHNKGD